MFIKFEIEKKKEYWLLSALSSLLCGVLAYVWGVEPVAAVLIGLLLLAVLTLRIHFDEKTPVWVTALICGFFSLTIYAETQLAVGTTVWQVSPLKTLMNWIVIFAMILLISAACGRTRYALIAMQLLWVLLGIANHMVVQTRGMEMQFTDLTSFGTAMAVAGGYKYTFSARTIAAIFLALISTLFLILNRMPKLRSLKHRIGSLSIGTVSLCMAVLLITSSWGAALIAFERLPWKIQSSTKNGFLVSFLHSISASKVSPPSGYSKDKLQAMLTEYQDELDKLTKPPITKPSNPDSSLPPDASPDTEQNVQTKPNIIVIMNESFSDLSSVAAESGKELLTDAELLPFFSSLSDDAPNISKGYAMSSVFGGNTANSEFEFLTGNSMAFLPTNTVAYNLYLKEENSFTVVDIMNKCGYYTVGMHPEPGSNWNRTELYQYFGFNETYFLESVNDGAQETFVNGIPLTDSDYYRGHVSDGAVYDRIIDLYEQKDEGQPLFAFAVTMQNHGGYNTKGFEYTVQVQGEGGGGSVNEYLSSIQNSDAALEELIAYFEQQEEDTLIVFFGDHQPSLTSAFYSTYFGVDDNSSTQQMQAKYIVPYLYWGNFDFESEFDEVTSLNYLSSHMLDIAGLPKTEFLKFTDLVEQEVIAINSFGWWDKDHIFHSLAEEDSDSVNLLLLYKYLQYNELFDKADDKLYSWFVLPEDAILPTKEDAA